MKTEQATFSLQQGWDLPAVSSLRDSAQLVFLFGQRELLKDPSNLAPVRAAYPSAHLVGCSTSGEILDVSVSDNHIVATAIHFEKTGIEVAVEPISAMEESFAIGEKLAERLDKPGLVHVLILSEGLNINGSELTKGINSRLCGKAAVTGGLAGDQEAFQETVIVNNGAGERNLVLGIGFYGSHLQVGYGSLGGWDSFGVDREITRSRGNILYEVDGQPALQLYKRYLGDHAASLPASALRFPMSLRLPGDEEKWVVRTVLAVDEADGSMTFAGDVPQGYIARLMKANFDRLIEGAHGAAGNSLLRLNGSEPDLALLISCVGRKLVLKQRTDEELESVREVIGNSVVMTGFYSYGEICPTRSFEQSCELHNQTMTITLMKET